MEIKIKREPDQLLETKGQLFVGDWQCKTLELPWKENKHQISCIPSGTYEWVKVNGFNNIPYLHISVLAVPNRSGICIHAGNFASGKKVNTEGCILVGREFTDINSDGILDITNSKKTLDKLLAILPDSGTLIIE